MAGTEKEGNKERKISTDILVGAYIIVHKGKCPPSFTKQCTKMFSNNLRKYISLYS